MSATFKYSVISHLLVENVAVNLLCTLYLSNTAKMRFITFLGGVAMAGQVCALPALNQGLDEFEDAKMIIQNFTSTVRRNFAKSLADKENSRPQGSAPKCTKGTLAIRKE